MLRSQISVVCDDRWKSYVESQMEMQKMKKMRDRKEKESTKAVNVTEERRRGNGEKENWGEVWIKGKKMGMRMDKKRENRKVRRGGKEM